MFDSQGDTTILNSTITSEIQELNSAKSKYLENRRKLDEERTKALEKVVRS